MKKKWTFEPVMSDFVGWDIRKSDSKEMSVGFVFLTEDFDESKDNVVLISAAPELLNICKKSLKYIDKNSDLYNEMENVINLAEGLDVDYEKLDYFDDKENIFHDTIFEIDPVEDKITYVPQAKISELFSFYELNYNVGVIKMKIEGNTKIPHENEDEDDTDLKFPIPHLISKNIYNDYIKFLESKYDNVGCFVKDYSAQKEYFIDAFLYDMFFNEFSKNYIVTMSLKDYIDKYPLVNNSKQFSEAIKLPKFLDNCPHSIHIDLTVKYKGEQTDGILFFNEKKNQYFVFNTKEKSIAFFIINNTEEDKNNTILDFVDLIRKDELN